MPKGYKPAVFVSSTCYDLSQIRADLKLFFESLGLDPILSEHNSFPINPSSDTVSSCIETVKNKSDVFVLVVGGRYGYQTNSGKSVTNLEYLEAKFKGTPIYVFVNQSIMNIMPVWERNKDADYSSQVDNTKILEFVHALKHEADNHWIFPFEYSQDITNMLKTQLAYLFMDALNYRHLIQGQNFSESHNKLTALALEILYTKPKGWEYRLFAQILKDKIESYSNERLDLKYGLTYAKVVGISDALQLTNWLSNHLDEAKRVINALLKLINEGLPVAFGESGVAGDDRHIIYIANRLGEGYKKLIDWALEFKNVKVEENYQKALELCSHISDNAICEIEEFANRIHIEINKAIDNIDISSEPVTLNLILTLTAPDMTEFNDEIERLSNLQVDF